LSLLRSDIASIIISLEMISDELKNKTKQRHGYTNQFFLRE